MSKVGDTLMEDISNEHLSHYGILGQKWGQRRYQNEDGTLTEEGKARYGKNGRSNWKQSDLKNLSDAELRRRLKRLNMEKQYKDMTEPPMSKRTKEILKQIFLQTAITVLSGYVASKYKEAGAAWLDHNASKFIQTAAKAKGAQWVV